MSWYVYDLIDCDHYNEDTIYIYNIGLLSYTKILISNIYIYMYIYVYIYIYITYIYIYHSHFTLIIITNRLPHSQLQIFPAPAPLGPQNAPFWPPTCSVRPAPCSFSNCASNASCAEEMGALNLGFFSQKVRCKTGLGHPSEKYEFVNWDDEIPNISGKIKNGNQTTNQKMFRKLRYWVSWGFLKWGYP